MTEPKPSARDLDLSSAHWLPGAGEASEADEIEIAYVDDYVLMRSRTQPEGHVLVFTHAEWDAFIAGVKDGEFDVSPEP